MTIEDIMAKRDRMMELVIIDRKSQQNEQEYEVIKIELMVEFLIAMKKIAG